MSKIHIRQISKKLQEEIAPFLKDSAKDKESQILSKCLAAFGIKLATGCSNKAAALSVTDGADDNGIDAVYYSEDTKKLVVCQAKWVQDGKSEPSSGDVGKFMKGVRDLVNLEKSNFSDKFDEKWDSINKALDSFGVEYELVTIYTGAPSLGVHSVGCINETLEMLNDPEPLFHSVVLNLGEVYNALAKDVHDLPIKLQMTLTNWGKNEAPHMAYYGLISGGELANFFKDYGPRLFARNIRSLLGSTVVNEEIAQTLKKSPEYFYYFNNGITITADTVKKSGAGGTKRDIGLFEVNAASIVNGAQTVSTIGKYAEEFGLSSLDSVSVPVRIISLEHSEEDFGNSVTRANNTQNRIEGRDFVVHDKEQIRLVTELKVEGYTYNVKRSILFKANDKSFDLIEACIALACLHQDVGLAVQVKREIGRFWADLNKAPYKSIFNPTTTALMVVNAVIVLRTISEVLVYKEFQRKGEHCGIIAHGNRMIQTLVFNALGRSRVANCHTGLDDMLGEIPNLVDEQINKLELIISRDYKNAFLGSLFKNQSKCELIYNECVGNIQPVVDTVDNGTDDLFAFAEKK
ncbi:AIPR family protein [Rubritalea squalenifaciens]|nr:AIPR family protein [Rubritalea squalenifaciens]